MRTLRTIVAGLLLGVPTSAQIDVHEYLPLGVFDAWRAERADGAPVTTTLRVEKVALVEGVLRYTLSIPALDGLSFLELVVGSEQGTLVMYSSRFATAALPSISGQKLVYDPPIVLGDGATVLDGVPVETAVETQLLLTVPVSGGIYESSMKTVVVDVGGTIASSWLSVPTDLVTPLGTVPAADLARHVIAFDLTLSATGEVDFDDTFTETIGAVLARTVGYVQVTNGAAADFVLEKAILPGQTLGDFPVLPAASFVGVTAPTPGLFTLHEASDATTTGGDVVLSDVRIEHLLSGQLFVQALAAQVGSLEPPVPVQLTGKCKLRATGDARLNAKGKVTLPGMAAPVSLAIAQDVDATTTVLDIAYKSGNALVGLMQLGVAPVTADSVVVELVTPVDRLLEPKPARALGAEGTLTLGTATFPVTALGTVKSKAGQPDKHLYSLTPTGLQSKIMKVRGNGTDETDFAVDAFSLKLFGRKVVVPAIELVVPTVE